MTWWHDGRYWTIIRSPPHKHKGLLEVTLRDLNRELNSLFAGFLRDQTALESERAKADPKAHKLCRIMADGKPASYRYVPAGKDGRGRAIWFCWSCWRNAAGYFLGWREVRTREYVKRDQWIARKVRRRARALAHRRVAAFKAKRQGS